MATSAYVNVNKTGNFSLAISGHVCPGADKPNALCGAAHRPSESLIMQGKELRMNLRDIRNLVYELIDTQSNRRIYIYICIFMHVGNG